MKIKALFLALSVIAITSAFAQINPLGLYVDIDGKVKFWESEANENGEVDDTVYITVNGERYLDDMRNLKYHHLTIIEAPSADWISLSNLDPSRINDTSRNNTFGNGYGINSFSFGENHYSYYYLNNQFTILTIDSTATNNSKRLFTDESRGEGLTDSVLLLVKLKLTDYVSNRPWSDEKLEKLHTEISGYDTMIEGVAHFDYIVDLFLAYDYDKKDRLTRVLGYHWNQTLEVDSLKYDKKGNLIYFSRQQLGINKSEYFFKYDKFGRVVGVDTRYLSFGSENSIESTRANNIKFTYNNLGKVNSKSVLDDGILLTYYFDIK